MHTRTRTHTQALICDAPAQWMPQDVEDPSSWVDASIDDVALVHSLVAEDSSFANRLHRIQMRSTVTLPETRTFEQRWALGAHIDFDNLLAPRPIAVEVLE